ncbi:MAG: hypothetical protein H6661_09410 [Ardenticatenaceae bacterium]|nr:hypothetical protein [Ardenticatenaceae bacterium]
MTALYYPSLADAAKSSRAASGEQHFSFRLHYRTVEESTPRRRHHRRPPRSGRLDRHRRAWQKSVGLGGGYDLMVLKRQFGHPGPQAQILLRVVHSCPQEATPRPAEHRPPDTSSTLLAPTEAANWLLDYHEIHLLLQSQLNSRKQAKPASSGAKTPAEPAGNTSPRSADLNRNFSFAWGCAAAPAVLTMKPVANPPPLRTK